MKKISSQIEIETTHIDIQAKEKRDSDEKKNIRKGEFLKIFKKESLVLKFFFLTFQIRQN